MSDNTIILYGIPAYGHIHSNLYLAVRWRRRASG